MKNPFSLEEKTILVTGASSGIGRSVAVECSRMGATIVLVGRNEERLLETCNSLEGHGHSVIVGDIQRNDTLEKIVEQSPVLQGIVHSAGIDKVIPFLFTDKKTIDNIFGINFFAPIALTQMIIKSKKIRHGSSIVFISTIEGVITSHVGSGIYASSKAALTAMARNMAVELAAKRIRVNNVLPGRIETPIRKAELSPETPEQVEKDKQLYPLKRYGSPEEAAYAVIYLLSDASSFTTGTNLVVDGGFTLL
jgi:NAD(P)-dependent dehydrogenase (short-subunit alcohol dehydrogenase family)